MAKQKPETRTCKERYLKVAFLSKVVLKDIHEVLTHYNLEQKLELTDHFGKLFDELREYSETKDFVIPLQKFTLGGKLIEGNHEIMVPKEVFLKVNDLLTVNTQGYNCHEENEPVPLKRFVKCGHCNTAMRGYIVKGKNIPYYMCNTKGCCNTKSAKDLHLVFEFGLAYLTLQKATGLLSLVKKQIIAIYNNTNKEKENHSDIIKRQILEYQQKIDRLEERLILEEITLDLYNKYLPKYKVEIIDLERALLKTTKRLSNLEDGINKVMELCAILPKMWSLLPYKDKQIFQKLIFP